MPLQNRIWASVPVTSPSDGVIGTFPYRVGALVSPSVAEPLTTVSQIGDMYVYFSMTEKQLLALTKAGGTLKEQLERCLLSIAVV